jgi:hypothetical protein
MKNPEKVRNILEQILTAHLDNEDLGVTDDLGVIMKQDFVSITNEIMILIEQLIIEHTN